WDKRRLYCDNDACGQRTFAETGPVAERGARVSVTGRETMGHLVGDWLVPVRRVADALGSSWHTAQDALDRLAELAGITVTLPADADADAMDAVGGAGVGKPLVVGPDDDYGGAGGAGVRRSRRSVSGPRPGVGVLGIDDHRRGRPRYHQDPVSGRWVADADRWATGLFDATGGHGLLGVVEGRTVAGTVDWLAAQPEEWLAGIWAVTIDMSTTYASAAREALPHALLAIDGFHVSQLANKAIGDTRRRVTHELRGRRGRATDPEYTIRGLLVRAEEKLSPAARGKLLCTLADLGGNAALAIGTAWRAKEHLRAVLALSPTRSGLATCRTDIDRALTRFFEYAATTGATVPEVVTLAETVSRWREEIANAVLHGLSNATAEGVNRLIKLVYRTAFGLTNIVHQQTRARYVASRATRPAWPLPVTTTTSTA
ncbi:DDE transposase, partial [Frankia sp. B2]